MIAAPAADFLNAVAAMEEDLDLPRGVQSRKDPRIYASIYWTGYIDPSTVDRHIAYAKMGGFSMMLIYFNAIFISDGYALCGDYDYRPSYPKGADSLREMLDKIKKAGITPGFHFLHTHIGLKSRYVTPVADPRLNLKQRYTLAKPLGKDDTEICVTQEIRTAPTKDGVRVLKFGGELITYEAYSDRCFRGCQRGAYNTLPEWAAGSWISANSALPAVTSTPPPTYRMRSPKNWRQLITAALNSSISTAPKERRHPLNFTSPTPNTAY